MDVNPVLINYVVNQNPNCITSTKNVNKHSFSINAAMSYRDELENPLAIRSRLYTPISDPLNEHYYTSNNKAVCTTVEEASLFLRIIHAIQSYLNIYELYARICSSLSERTDDRISHPKEESKIMESATSTDSEIEILKVNHVITNDYHLLNRNTPRQQNSILLSDDEDDEIQEPQPFVTTNSYSVLHQLALARLNKVKDYHQHQNLKANESQYGTDLSIADTSTSGISTMKRYRPPSRPSTIPQTISNTIFDHQQTEPTPYQQSILNYYVPSKPVSMTSYSIIDNFISNYYIDKISSIYTKGHDKIQEMITQKRLEAISTLKPLTDDQLAHVHKAWTSINQLFTTNYQIEIYSRDLQTLRDGLWLNDNIIDYYFNLIMKEYPDVYGWTTHFYTTLESKGYTGVARWAKRKKLNSFQKRLILVPVNISNTHWALAVINNPEKTITYFDSLDTYNAGNPQAVANLCEYMKQEAKRLNEPELDYKLVPHLKTPQQNNGSDCGVFTCTAARYIAGGRGLTYGQKDMKVMRRRMAFEIMNNTLLE